LGPKELVSLMCGGVDAVHVVTDGEEHAAVVTEAGGLDEHESGPRNQGGR
jgi:hypothetical protein